MIFSSAGEAGLKDTNIKNINYENCSEQDLDSLFYFWQNSVNKKFPSCFDINYEPKNNVQCISIFLL